MSAPGTSVIPFEFHGHGVRAILDEVGNPWFVAGDVCEALGIRNVSLAINGNPSRPGRGGLDDDERGIRSVNTPSGEQQMLVVNESGLKAAVESETAA